MIDLSKLEERVILAAVSTSETDQAESSLDELKELADTCYSNSDHIVDLVEQIVTTFHPVGEHPTGNEMEKSEGKNTRKIILEE